MASEQWTDDDVARLKSMVERGESFTDIAKSLHRTPGATAKKSQHMGFHKARPTELWTNAEERAALALDFPTFKRLYPDRSLDAYFTKRSKSKAILSTSDLDLVDYTTLVETIEGDALVCACVHVPQTDPRMWMKALAIGERDKIENLIIAGDIVTADMFSRWQVTEDWSFDKELDSLYRHLSAALAIFKFVYITPGNHVSNRIVNVSNGHIRLKHLIDMAGLSEGDRERVFTTDIDFLELRSGEERFLIGHASNYSNIDGRVSTAYAEKEECHVITGNGHRFGQQASKSGKWFAWDIGTMADPKYMGYVNRQLTKFPKMLQSFLTVRNGAVRVYAAGPPITDWASELHEENNPRRT